MKRKERCSKSVENAVERFKEGFNCSQAIVLAYGPKYGLSAKPAAKAGAGFGGGMGQLGETCGAVTGAILIIGLKHCPADAKDRDAKLKTYALVRKLAQRFKKRNRSIICRDLLGCDINTKKGLIAARKAGIFQSVCPKLVRDAAQILETML